MITMTDVAKRVGVSQSTVSCVLNGRYNRVGVSVETRERILETAREMGYRPHSSARALRAGRFGSVALLLSAEEHHSYLPGALHDGIQEALNARDLHLTLAKAPDEQLTEKGFLPKILRSSVADGLLINYTQAVPDALERALREHQLPSIWINADRTEDCVRPDDREAGQRLTERLLALRHTRIAYLSQHELHPAPWIHYSVFHRFAGYEQAMRAAGLAPRLLDMPVSLAEIETRARLWLNRPDRPTAVIAYGPGAALAVRFAALSLGLRVPDDLSIAAFGLHSADESGGKPLTMALVPEREMGKAAVEDLLRRIDTPGESLPLRILPFAFDGGATCAPPIKLSF